MSPDRKTSGVRGVSKARDKATIKPKRDVFGKTQATVKCSRKWFATIKVVYHVQMKEAERSWDIFRHYTEFCRLHSALKKQVAGLSLKLPGKRLFGSQFDPAFLKSRCEGLTDYIRLIITVPKLISMQEVRYFLVLDSLRTGKNKSKISSDDSGVDTCNGVMTRGGSGDDESSCTEDDSRPCSTVGLPQRGNINLGPSERPLKPNDFEFLRVLGRGLFGKVFLARRYSTQKLFAVKVLNMRAVVRRNETQHIMAERNVLRRNHQHPFLVSLHSSFQTREKLYFVLDYVNGGEMLFGLPPFYSRLPLHFREYIPVSSGGKDLLHGLLQKDGRIRLGAGPSEFDELHQHEFYTGLNWDDLNARRIEPPFRPELSDAYDLRNIEPEFIREPVPASMIAQQQLNNVSRSMRAASSLGCRDNGDNVLRDSLSFPLLPLS